MKNNEPMVSGAPEMEFLHAKPELSTGIGSFYTDALTARLPADVLAFREQQRRQPIFNRESM